MLIRTHYLAAPKGPAHLSPEIPVDDLTLDLAVGGRAVGENPSSNAAIACHHLRMGKRRAKSQGQRSARLLWQARGERFFDPAGVEYELSRVGLGRAEFTRALEAGGLPVAVHNCGEGVNWWTADKAREGWSAVQSEFEDVQGWQPPADAPGALPYRAELWRALSRKGEVLLLRND